MPIGTIEGREAVLCTVLYILYCPLHREGVRERLSSPTETVSYRFLAVRALAYSFPGKCIKLKEESMCGMHVMTAKDFLSIYMGSSIKFWLGWRLCVFLKT